MLTISAIVLSLSSLLLTVPNTDNSSEKTATVHIRAVDNRGRDLQGQIEVMEFRDVLSHGPDVASSFRANTGIGIPFGVYRIRIRMPGFWTAERNVRVYEAEVWVVQALETGMGPTEGGQPTSLLIGRLKNVESPTSGFRIRLTGVFSSVVMDTFADQSGRFEFGTVPDGCYVIVVTREQVILASQTFCSPVGGDEALSIDLPRKRLSR